MIALAWAFAYATSARTTEWVSPWEMELIKPSDDCAQLCGNWSALYLADTGCKGADMVAPDTVRFCPNTEEVEAWTFDDESIYEDMYHNAEESELKIFERLTLERMMKLSVHPWQTFQFKDIHAQIERRRKQGSAKKKTCIGEAPNLGRKRTKHKGQLRPQKVAVQFQNVDGQRVMSQVTINYPYNKLRGGEKRPYARTKSVKLPGCTTVVYGKSGNGYLNAIQFLSQGKESKLLGDDINDSRIIVAPQGTCLGNMLIRSSTEFVHRLCFFFNGNEVTD